MSTTLLTIEIRYEQDVVLTRQRARQIAELIGFDIQERTRIATAVSEIARNAFQYAGGGKVQFAVDPTSKQFLIKVYDQGPGIANLKQILDGQYISKTGMGLGITGTQKLMDQFEIESVIGSTTVLMAKKLPRLAPELTAKRLIEITDELVKRSPQNPLEEIQQQNQELLRALAEIQKREQQLHQLNQELEDTNRGVVALYAELDEKADSLKLANELKTRFLSNMSHEFRTPLNSIVSLSRLLLERMDGDLTPEQEKQVIFIRKAAEGLGELVNDLLDLAKVEAGKISVHPSHFEVSELFATLRGMLRPLLAHNSSVSLVFEEPVNIPTLYTDEGKVAQILRNFISNSLKYTERGEVRVSAVRVEDNLNLSVSDTGIGIAPQDRERIFEDFVQVESHLQHNFKGTGLGLPLSRRLAELLGGRVAVTSKLEVGSTFSASIPLIYSGATQTTLKYQPNWQPDPVRAPVLVVEDNAETLFVYEKYLAQSNYQIIEAQTLEHAYQALEKVEPVAIILDLLLEKQHTWAFLSQMKNNPATREIPVLVVTVVNNEKQAIALGADGFLVKPVEKLTLLNKLNQLVNHKQPQKLLLIDDDLVARYLLKQKLSDIPLSIIEAENGKEGIRMAQSHHPQAIVLDLSMPEINGFQVLKELKSDPITSLIPVIISTCEQLEPAEEKFLSELAVAVISKESSSQEVAIATIREALLKAGLSLQA